MLRPPDGAPPARILLYGASGTGKTRAPLSIARRLAQSGSPSRMYVLDTDQAWPWKLMDGDPGNVEVLPATDWTDLKSGLLKFEKAVTPGDWLVVDMIGPAWDAVQGHFIREITGLDEDDYFLMQRKELKKGARNLSALSGWVDWPVINKMYRTWMNRVLGMVGRGVNLLCTTTSERVNEETDEKVVRDMFAKLGGKPGGQKHLPHSFNTILRLGRAGDQWVMTTAKEWREGVAWVERAAVNEFWLSYLVKVAGWKP